MTRKSDKKVLVSPIQFLKRRIVRSFLEEGYARHISYMEGMVTAYFAQGVISAYTYSRYTDLLMKATIGTLKLKKVKK